MVAPFSGGEEQNTVYCGYCGQLSPVGAGSGILDLVASGGY